VDLARGKVAVRHTLFTKRGGYALKEPKTASSRRQIRIGPDVISAVRVHRTNQQVARLQLGAAWHDLGLVFAREDGYYQRPTSMGRALTKLLKRADLPRIRVHDLRHTAATLALRAGEHPKKVSEMLGHSSVAITLDLYSHVLPDMQESLADAMNTMLFG
jgi:integrase